MGYDLINGELIINELQAEIVRRVFTLRREGETLVGIPDFLHADSVPTKKGAKWSKVQIKEMLDRQAFYKRTYKQGGVIAVGQHQAIVYGI
jgi:hypothetical protein